MNDEEQEKTILPLPWWAVILIFIFCAPSIVFATPMFATTSEGITITLTDEPCALDAVSNLKYRATWVEKEKTFEGCWAPHREMGVVIAYFDDKTVALIPVQAFQKVIGA
jgi:hypothetical protein